MEFSKLLKLSVLTAVMAFLSGCSTVEVHRVGSMLGSRPIGIINGKLESKSEYNASDIIHFTTTITWDDVTRPGGTHLVVWNWYKEGKLISRGVMRPYFGHAPFTIHDSKPALALGGGYFKVELLIDGKRISKEEFAIRW